MAFTVKASDHAEWEQNSLADYGDFSDCVEYCNQSEDAFSGYGDWHYIPDEPLAMMKDVGEYKANERVIYFGSYGNDNSPGASHYTYAEIFDMDDEDDAAEFEKRKAEWESCEEYLPCDDEDEDEDEDEDDSEDDEDEDDSDDDE